MKKKNVLTKKVEAGIMTFGCDFCGKRGGTGFVSVPLVFFSYIKAWGAKVVRPRCHLCNEPFEVTLTP